MKWLNDYKMVLVVGCLVIFMVCSGNPAGADFTFGEPVNLGTPVNTSQSWTGEPAISLDGLELYFTSERLGGSGGPDIWVTKRSTTDDPWGEPANLGLVVNSSAVERGPSISSDGLELYFVTKKSGNWEICVSKRSTKNDDWGTPVVILILGTPGGGVASTSISTDGLELYFEVYLNENWYDIFVMKRDSKSAPWGFAESLGLYVNHPVKNDMQPCISSDGLAIFFWQGGQLSMTTRSSTSDLWRPSERLTSKGFISSSWDYAPSISNDGSVLYFESDRSGSIGQADIWQVPIKPIVDLNVDGTVDVKDVVTLTDHWGENNPQYDIGPMPWGDGIVDTQDLLVLTEYLIGHAPPVAHWALDETEGMIAQDIAGNNDAYVIGDPLWQPTEGKVGGALQLDGIDDCVVTDFVLNPADGAFSVFVWIKDGAPGQTVVSQMGGTNWLCTDPSKGNLMTELTGIDLNSNSLQSQTSITDGAWHQIGFVWDGSYRRLYVDSVMVAEDAQDNLDVSSNGLYFGTGKTMESGTFFSGLIDDIRIYSRVVHP